MQQDERLEDVDEKTYIWHRPARPMPWHAKIDDQRLQLPHMTERVKPLIDSLEDELKLWSGAESPSDLQASLTKEELQQAIPPDPGMSLIVSESGPVVRWRNPCCYCLPYESGDRKFFQAHRLGTHQRTEETKEYSVSVMCVNYSGYFIEELIAQATVNSSCCC